MELAVVTAISLTLFALLMPNIEESRQETRIQVAWANVRQIRKALDNPSAKADLPEKDPWGQPYLEKALADGSIRVLSTGANEKTTADGPDDDDVYSDMVVSPLTPFHLRRAKELNRAVLIAGGLWIVFFLAWLRENRRKARPSAVESK
ncbi:MAG: hypothetical protein IT428_23695 [Planctomycetaceae bacterium]|nr:hypothetical protein [Planctomycetaceae bacterium]